MLVFTLRVIGLFQSSSGAGVGMRIGQERAGRGWRAARRGLGPLIGGLWLHQGIWSKVLGVRPEQADIVAGVPLVGHGRGRPVSGYGRTPWGARRIALGGAHLLFGRMHEDASVDEAVLAGAGRVFAIASAGDTALRLARRDRRVTAVDVHPAQVAYVR